MSSVNHLNVDEPGGPPAESAIKLRIAEVCRQAWRLSQHVQSVSEAAEVIAADIVNGLGAAAAAIWELDDTAAVWRLIGAGGELEPHGWRSCIRVIRHGGRRPGAAVADRLIDDVQQLLQSVDVSHRHARTNQTVVAVPIEIPSRPARALAIWSDELDEDDLGVVVKSVAHDVGSVFDAVHNRLQCLSHARLYCAIFDNAPCAVAGVDQEGRCTRWNDAAAQLFGWGVSEIRGRPVRFVAPQSREIFRATVEFCREGIRPAEMQLTCRHESGDALQTRMVCVPVIGGDEHSEVLLLISDETSNDVRQRVGRCETEVASLLSASTSVPSVGRPLLESACRRMNWDGGELWELSGDGERWNCSAVWRAAAGDESAAVGIHPGCSLRSDVGLPGLVLRSREISSVAGDNGTCQVGVPICCDDRITAVVVFAGVSTTGDGAAVRQCLQFIGLQIGQALSRQRVLENLQKAEESLQQTRKMEAIGMLAGGIAHDFNNLLMVILGNCEMLQSQSFDAAETAEMLEEIRVVGERAATLTRKLLTFSRKRSSEPEALNPSHLLKECEGMLERLASGDVVLEIRTPVDIHPIRIDKIEFEQVLLNLVANARDAMPEGGKISISLANAELTLRDVLSFPDVRPGDFVELSVRDTGCGMDEQTQARAFEPFFTTKQQEKGTGLGLATVYGIVRQSRGVVKLDSAPGAGTRFALYFPRATIGIKPRRIDGPLVRDPRGTETILVVDDEDAVRRLVQRILEVHGYKAHAIDGGRAALQFLSRDGQECDLLLTDVMMPEMNGRRLAAEAQKLRAGLPILFMSGYQDSRDAAAGEDESLFLRKPFSSDALVNAVRHALDNVRCRRPP